MNEISGTLLAATLDYVTRAAGDHARATVMSAAGITESDCPVNGEWVTMETTLAVAHAAAIVLGDQDIGWRIGEELMRQSVDTGFDQFITETGTITAALTTTAEYGSRMSSGRRNQVVDQQPGQVTIESTYDPLPPTNFFCRLQAGYYATVPGAFGGTGFVTEPACQLRGDAHCRFVVRWTGGDLRGDDIRAAARGSDAIVRQFEDMEEIAAELARVQDTEEALECIMARVGAATMAPRFLLAVNVGDTAPLRVHSRGFQPSEAAAVARADS